jgi:sigma-B regulation protein RsbU (phosphoserine phosphatase)
MQKAALPARIAPFIIGEAGEAKLRLMVEINRKISTSPDLDEVLNFIVEAARKVISYDAAGIYLLDPKSEAVKYVVGRGYTDQFEVPLTSHDGIVGSVITTGKSVLASEVVDNPNYLNVREQTRSQLTVPIRDGKIIGAFNLESDQPGGFTENDLEWLTVLATQIAITIDKAVLQEELLDKKRLDEELRIAREVQLSLFPAATPSQEGLDVGGINIPSRDIGGDYYDFIPIVAGHLGVVIADVVGKGIPASLIMASFRAFLRAEIRNNYAIRTIFAKVNKLLHEILKPNQFVSAFYGVLDLERRRFTYSNAGHPPALLLRPDGKWQYLKSGGLVLGIFEDVSYKEQFIDLRAGDLLVLYTDGLVEAENKAGEMFGCQRLQQFVQANADLPAGKLCEAIYVEMRRFTEDSRPEDDTTIVVAKVLPTAAGESGA